MTHSPTRSEKAKRGVTLTELLVVIAIISILVALIMPALGTHTQDEGTCKKVYTKIGVNRLTEFMAVFECKSGKTLTLWCREDVWNTINTNESYRIKYVDSFTDELMSAEK